MPLPIPLYHHHAIAKIVVVYTFLLNNLNRLKNKHRTLSSAQQFTEQACILCGMNAHLYAALDQNSLLNHLLLVKILPNNPNVCMHVNVCVCVIICDALCSLLSTLIYIYCL